MFNIAFKGRWVYIAGVFVALMLLFTQSGDQDLAAATPTCCTPVQRKVDKVPMELDVAFSGNTLIAMVTFEESDGRPWTGIAGDATLLDFNGRQVAMAPMQPLGPGRFRVIAPLGQLDTVGYLDLTFNWQDNLGGYSSRYEINRATQTARHVATVPVTEKLLSPDSPESTGGPDAFGYEWSNEITYAWVDTSGGTAVSSRDDDYWSGPFSIGFDFDFYENTYTQFYIDSNGYIGFDDGQTASYYLTGYVPLSRSARPNNLIAPFWGDFDPSSEGTIRYQLFGVAPNRYLVIEWNAVPVYGLTDTQTFQVILSETTNDIVFQYPTTRMGTYGDRSYATVGIENADGTIALEYPYTIPIDQEVAILFDYNRPQYNPFTTPEELGSLAPVDDSVDFYIEVRNLGTSSDAFTLSRATYSGENWPVSFFHVDGTPLSANSTGSISAGGSKEIKVSVAVPDSAAIGDASYPVIRATSQGNGAESYDVDLDVAVGSSFAQVYTDNESGDGTEDNENYFESVQDGYRCTTRVTTDLDNSNYAAIATTPGGRAFDLWTNNYYNGNAWVADIQYVIMNRYCASVAPLTRLTNNAAATTNTYDFSPAADVAANGNTLIGWARQPGIFDVWYAVVADDGHTVKAPTNLTNNPSDVNKDYPPSVAALADGRFLLTWEHASEVTAVGNEPAATVVDIYYAIISNTGSVLVAPTRLTDGTGVNYTPRVAALADGGAAIVWTTDNTFGYSEIAYALVNSSGAVTSAPALVTHNEDSEDYSSYADPIGLSDGRLAVAFSTYFATTMQRHIQYTLIDTAVTPLEGIYGQVTYQGSGIAGINLALRFYNGSSWSTAMTTTTQADGSYSFVGASSLGASQKYYVLYDNGDYGNAENPNYISFWASYEITSYTAGSSTLGGNFDISNIVLTAPSAGATVPLPQAFQWTPRSGVTSDSYQFAVFDYTDNDPFFATSALGYVGSYTLNDLPSGFVYDTQYGWNVAVYGPDGGWGASYYYYFVTFEDAGGPQGIYGTVTAQGTPVQGINVILRHYDGASWSTAGTVATGADGSYDFVGIPTLESGGHYYMRYNNGQDGNADNPSYLWYNRSFYIDSYTAGTVTSGGSFDIGNIALTAPADGATVSLPYTFQWTSRGFANDHYRLFMFCSADSNSYYLPDVGNSGSYTLGGLGASCAGQWYWHVQVYPTSEYTYTLGYGDSYEWRPVNFSTQRLSPQQSDEMILVDDAHDYGTKFDNWREIELPEHEVYRAPDGFSRSGDLPFYQQMINKTRPASAPSATLYTILHSYSVNNTNVSLTLDEDENLIMTWLEGLGKEFMLYAMADSDGTLVTPPMIYQRARGSRLELIWNGYGNDRLASRGLAGPNRIFLPFSMKLPPYEPAPVPDNGGFEILPSFTDWQYDGNTGLTPQVVTSPVFEGSRSALLGQKDAPCLGTGVAGQSWVSQDFTIEDYGSPRLRFSYRIYTYDKLNADKYDRFEVYINGNLLGRFGYTGAFDHTTRCSQPVSDLGWQTVTYDVGAYRGQPVTLRFVNVTTDEWFGTWTYVDDVEILYE